MYHYLPLTIIPQQNILINDKGEPLLAEFGLSKVCPLAMHRAYSVTDNLYVELDYGRLDWDAVHADSWHL